MYLRITSKHPKEEVEKLIRFAAEPYDLRRVCVNVKNSQHAYRGRAYSRVPREYSNAPRTAKRLVVIAVGSADKFTKPLTNLYTTYRWVRIEPGEPYDVGEVRSCEKYVNGTTETWLEKRIPTKAPYGGKKSPLIVYTSWQEAMVAIAAHEFHHIHQFQNKLRCAERYCERAAAEALERYRATLSSPSPLATPLLESSPHAHDEVAI